MFDAKEQETFWEAQGGALYAPKHPLSQQRNHAKPPMT